MKKYLLLTVVFGLLVGCSQKKHPVKVFIDPAIRGDSIEKIAVFPFASSLHHTDDPDGDAPRTMDVLFRHELDGRGDYNFMAPTSVSYALSGAGLSGDAKRFIDGWRRHQTVDREFLAELGRISQVDAVLIGVVDLWQKDEVDYREASATPTTYVGATITILGVADGAVLFQASDEDYLEGAQSEAGDRGTLTSALGSVQRDAAANVYKAPEYKEVAIKVVKALVSSIPAR